jgi:hypothetical protein
MIRTELSLFGCDSGWRKEGGLELFKEEALSLDPICFSPSAISVLALSLLVNPKFFWIPCFALLLVYDDWLCVNLGCLCVLTLTGRGYGGEDCYLVLIFSGLVTGTGFPLCLCCG